MWATPAVIADITNTVTASGIPDRGKLRTTSSTANVPVEQPLGRLDVSQDLGGITMNNGLDPTVIDSGDIAWFRTRMTNVGNAPLANVRPVPARPTFDGTAGTGEPPAVTLDTGNSTAAAPELLQSGETLEFITSYILTIPDVLRGARKPEGMENRAMGTGDGEPETNTSIVAYRIPPDPHLVTTARVDLDERYGAIGDGAAAVGDVLNYTYFVENVGNVAIRNVTVEDIHEEADPHRQLILSSESMRNERLIRDGPLAAEAPSSDRGQDGSWDVLEPGAVIAFGMTRTVSELEYLAQ